MLGLLLFTILSFTLHGTYGLEQTRPVPFRVGVIANETPKTNVTHLTDLLRHVGYPFDLISSADQIVELSHYSLLILYDSALSILGQSGLSALDSYGGDLIWIGPGIGAFDQNTLARIFGIQYISEGIGNALGVVSSSSGSTITAVTNETITLVQLVGGTARGYFNDNSSRRLFPSEVYMRHSSGTVAYYFAYDVSDWWKADPNLPWSRPAILVSAIRFALSNSSSITLGAYPMNLDTVFIERIEDVDPLNTGVDWLARASNFLQDFKTSQVPLAVALIPVYVDPAHSLTIPLDANSAEPLRSWLQSVIVSGGTIIQHGYTHQYGTFLTGAGTEFLLNGTWMNYTDQYQRIKLGKMEIQGSLTTKEYAFEAPHYKYDNDTVKAITELGFKYFFDDLNSPFFGFRYSLNSDEPTLVVFPETLSYIPLGSSMSLESQIKASIDQLLGFGGILLQYDHLYEENAFTMGIDTMHYVLQKGHVWVASIDTIGRFELERAESYRKFNVTIGPQITVNLGKFNESGLTLYVSGGNGIQWVRVNGKEWPLFKADHIILPKLPADTNTIVIGLQPTESNQPHSIPFGLAISAITVSVTIPFVRKIFKGEES